MVKNPLLHRALSRWCLPRTFCRMHGQLNVFFSLSFLHFRITWDKGNGLQGLRSSFFRPIVTTWMPGWLTISIVYRVLSFCLFEFCFLASCANHLWSSNQNPIFLGTKMTVPRSLWGSLRLAPSFLDGKLHPVGRSIYGRFRMEVEEDLGYPSHLYELGTKY